MNRLAEDTGPSRINGRIAGITRLDSLRDHWPLLPILVLAMSLRLWQINESLWLDELHSAWVVSDGLGAIVERAQIGNQSPLYFYLPWATTSTFGMSEWALRLPSLLAGIGVVAIAYRVAFEFTRSSIAASASSLLTALDHNFLFYATEARPYAVVQLLAAVQLLIFWRLQSGSSVRRRLVFIACSVTLFYLHYTAILLVAGEVVYMLMRELYRRDRADVVEYTVRKLTRDLLCVAVLILPAATRLSDIGARRHAWASFVNNTSLLLPVSWFSLVSYVVVPVSICVLGMGVGLGRGDTNERASAARQAQLLTCWLGVPLAIVWLLTLTRIAPLYLGRYVIGAALAPVVFAGLCVSIWESRRSQLLVAATTIVFALCSSGMIEQLLYDGRLFADRTENWRAAVRYVSENRVQGSLVFVRSGLLEADRLVTDQSESLREYCVSPVTSIYNIERASREIRPLPTSNAGTLAMEDVKSIEVTREAWFIINGSSATRERCRERIDVSLRKQTDLDVILTEYRFGNLGVYHAVLTIAESIRSAAAQPTSPNSIAEP